MTKNNLKNEQCIALNILDTETFCKSLQDKPQVLKIVNIGGIKESSYSNHELEKKYYVPIIFKHRFTNDAMKMNFNVSYDKENEIISLEALDKLYPLIAYAMQEYNSNFIMLPYTKLVKLLLNFEFLTSSELIQHNEQDDPYYKLIPCEQGGVNNET